MRERETLVVGGRPGKREMLVGEREREIEALGKTERQKERKKTERGNVSGAVIDCVGTHPGGIAR